MMKFQLLPNVARVLALFVLCGARAETVLHVDDDAPPGGNGSTWAAAYRFLQDALSAASGVGLAEIRVAQGVYLPPERVCCPGSLDPTESFQLLSGVALVGGFGGLSAPDPDERDLDAYPSILQGDLLGDDDPAEFPYGDTYDDNSLQIVTGSGVNSTAVLDGFVVTGAVASAMRNDFGSPTVVDCVFIANQGELGGAAANMGGAPLFSGCAFQGNSVLAYGVAVSYGGAVYNENSQAEFEDCLFASNGSVVTDRGGAMYNLSSDVLIQNCTFSAEYADFTQSSAYFGGAILNDGSGPILTACCFESLRAGSRGGAIANLYGSNPILTDCTFTGNTIPFYSDTARGGAIYNDFGSSPIIIGCTFTGNIAEIDDDPFSFYGEGGAIFNWADCAPVIIGCSFVGNSASERGGAIHNTFGDPVIVACHFADNTALRHAGGAVSNRKASCLLSGCQFERNESVQGGALSDIFAESLTVDCSFTQNSAEFYGGAASCLFAVTRFAGCTFSGNTSGYYGGVLATTYESVVVLTNCTLSGNSTGLYGGGVAVGPDDMSLPAEVVIRNCVLWDNDAGGEFDEEAQVWVDDSPLLSATVDYSCVQGLGALFEGPGNIGTDPMFVDPSADLRLASGSPCIDAGINWAVPPDLTDQDADGDTAELLPLDLDGNPRFADDPDTPDTGCGAPPVVDMGAYEFQGEPGQVLVGDIDGSGAVDVLDLLLVLGSWGPCDPGCCPADLDLDGTVGVVELLTVLGNWS